MQLSLLARFPRSDNYVMYVMYLMRKCISNHAFISIFCKLFYLHVTSYKFIMLDDDYDWKAFFDILGANFLYMLGDKFDSSLNQCMWLAM